MSLGSRLHIHSKSGKDSTPWDLEMLSTGKLFQLSTTCPKMHFHYTLLQIEAKTRLAAIRITNVLDCLDIMYFPSD